MGFLIASIVLFVSCAATPITKEDLASLFPRYLTYLKEHKDSDLQRRTFCHAVFLKKTFCPKSTSTDKKALLKKGIGKQEDSAYNITRQSCSWKNELVVYVDHITPGRNDLESWVNKYYLLTQEQCGKIAVTRHFEDDVPDILPIFIDRSVKKGSKAVKTNQKTFAYDPTVLHYGEKLTVKFLLKKALDNGGEEGEVLGDEQKVDVDLHLYATVYIVPKTNKVDAFYREPESIEKQPDIHHEVPNRQVTAYPETAVLLIYGREKFPDIEIYNQIRTMVYYIVHNRLPKIAQTKIEQKADAKIKADVNLGPLQENIKLSLPMLNVSPVKKETTGSKECTELPVSVSSNFEDYDIIDDNELNHLKLLSLHDDKPSQTDEDED